MALQHKMMTLLSVLARQIGGKLVIYIPHTTQSLAHKEYPIDQFGHTARLTGICVPYRAPLRLLLHTTEWQPKFV